VKDETLKTATIEGEYRYLLTRRWFDFFNGEAPHLVCFIMLNPSTADAEFDDATITRCINYAKLWGYNGIQVVNLFGLRSRMPSVLYTHPDPIGPLNDQYILTSMQECSLVVAAWGIHGEYQSRGEVVRNICKNRKIYCLSITKEGHPAHPLYLKKILQPTEWKMAA